MDSGYRSPLIELFRNGDAERAVRLAGAQGVLRLRAHEQLALLMLLVDDPDEEVARQAGATIGKLPAPALAAFLARPEVSDVMRAFFAARGVGPAPAASADQAEPQLEPADESQLEPPDEPTPAEDGESAGRTAMVLSSLPIIERLKLATKGSREQRAQLIRDSSKMVSTAVLSSPKVSESEIAAFARMANVSEDVLRIIGANRGWMKNYGVAHGLIRNPKTPPSISLSLLHRLNDRDVKALGTDRNVPEMLRLAARRIQARGKV